MKHHKKCNIKNLEIVLDEFKEENHKIVERVCEQF